MSLISVLKCGGAVLPRILHLNKLLNLTKLLHDPLHRTFFFYVSFYTLTNNLV